MNSFRWEEAYEVGRRGRPDERLGSESHLPVYICGVLPIRTLKAANNFRRRLIDGAHFDRYPGVDRDGT